MKFANVDDGYGLEFNKPERDTLAAVATWFPAIVAMRQGQGLSIEPLVVLDWVFAQAGATLPIQRAADTTEAARG